MKLYTRKTLKLMGIKLDSTVSSSAASECKTILNGVRDDIKKAREGLYKARELLDKDGKATGDAKKIGDMLNDVAKEIADSVFTKTDEAIAMFEAGAGDKSIRAAKFYPTSMLQNAIDKAAGKAAIAAIKEVEDCAWDIQTEYKMMLDRARTSGEGVQTKYQATNVKADRAETLAKEIAPKLKELAEISFS